MIRLAVMTQHRSVRVNRQTDRNAITVWRRAWTQKQDKNAQKKSARWSKYKALTTQRETRR